MLNPTQNQVSSIRIAILVFAFILAGASFYSRLEESTNMSTSNADFQNLPLGAIDCHPSSLRAMSAQRRNLCGVGVFLNEDPAPILESLPGIGPTRARLIVEDRKQNGPYGKPEDLVRIKGIGTNTIQKIIPWLEPIDSQSDSL